MNLLRGRQGASAVVAALARTAAGVRAGIGIPSSMSMSMFGVGEVVQQFVFAKVGSNC